MDPSLKPDPLRKGSYYRRIEDIRRALKSLGSDKLSETMLFLVLYFGCEKIAHGVVGIHARLPATKAYGPGRRIVLKHVKASAAGLGLSVLEEDLDWLFASDGQQHLLRPTAEFTNSARHLRNNLTHDFGPTNVARITKHAPFLNPKMKSLVGRIPEILAYQRLHFSKVS
jgi:hypothetical protein